MQEAAAERFDRIFEVDDDENSEPNVSKMLANGDGVECRPYRSRTCDTLIKRQRSSVTLNPPHSRRVPSSPDLEPHFVPDNPDSPIRSP